MIQFRIKKYPLSVIALVFFITTSCVDPLETKVINAKNYLVVEGFITTDEGPHDVLITRMSNFASRSNGGSINRVQDAKVYLIDQFNNKTELLVQTEISKSFILSDMAPCALLGVDYRGRSTPYRTPVGFKANVGDTYTLEIQMKHGKTYRSTPQKILEGPKIDSLTLRYKRLASTSKTKFERGIDVISNWKDPAGKRNYYSWRLNGVYHIESRPNDGQCCLYDPNDEGDQLCWIYENNLSGTKLAYSDLNADGNNVSLSIGFIKDDGYRFSSVTVPSSRQYFMEVEQMTLSPEAFEFYKGLETLISIDGDIFDPPPLNIKGNMSNVNDPNEQVLGFFGAYSVNKKSIFVKRDLFEDPVRRIGPCGDCRIRSGAVEYSRIPQPYL